MLEPETKAADLPDAPEPPESRKRGRRSVRFDQMRPDTEFTLGKEIGAGSFGQTKVHEAVDASSGAVVAIKVLPKKAFVAELVRREAKLHWSLGSRCPFIVPLLAFEEKADSFQMSMPKAECDLFELITRTIHSTGAALSEVVARKLLIQLLLALKFLHRRKIAHRDIKPENILVYRSKGERELQVKLCDFGSARSWDSGKHASFFVGPSLEDQAPGTVEYSSPEILASNSSRPYDERSDLWSLGVVLFVMLGGYTPFTGDNPTQLQQQAVRDDGIDFDAPGHVKFWRSISEDAKDLVQGFLTPAPRKRISINRAMRHPWLREEVEAYLRRAMFRVDGEEARRSRSNPPSPFGLPSFKEEEEEYDDPRFDTALMLFDDRMSDRRRSVSRRRSSRRRKSMSARRSLSVTSMSPRYGSVDVSRRSFSGERGLDPRWRVDDRRVDDRRFVHHAPIEPLSLRPVGDQIPSKRRPSYLRMNPQSLPPALPPRGPYVPPPPRRPIDFKDEVEEDECRCCIQ